MSETTAWVALSIADHVGIKTLRALLARFGDLRAVLAADSAALCSVPGIGPATAHSIGAVNVAAVEQALKRWQAAGVSVIPLTPDEQRYPASLSAVDDPPATLFMRGQWGAAPLRGVAVVGTRSPSPQGRAAARLLAFELARRGYAVVSGLARGIDTEAHLGAISAPGGRTLAVLGCGVLRIYPPENTSLAQLVMRNGALLSETAPDAPPSAQRLVARNRIISGLSEALIVVETAEDGGAMHAARRAREQGRTVYALDVNASGNRALIQTGALPLAPDLRDFPF